MALVKYGGGVIQMSGSIAGDTHARNRFGNYIRPRTKPVDPASADQIECRSIIAFLTQYWKDTLTAAERTAWDTYAAAVAMLNKLGETVYLTGFNHFLRANSFIKRIDETIVEAGPTVLSLPEQDPVFAISASAATQLVTITFDDTLVWCDEDGGFMPVYQGRPQNSTRNFFNGPWRYMNNIAGDSVTPPTSTETMTAPFTLVQNQKIWCYARIIRADGRMSNAFKASCVVAA